MCGATMTLDRIRNESVYQEAVLRSNGDDWSEMVLRAEITTGQSRRQMKYGIQYG